MTGHLRAWVDGTLVAADEAHVSAYDVGFRSGEGVFETLRAFGAHPFRLDAHVARAVAGAATLGFILDADRLTAAVRTTVDANLAAFDGRDSAVRVTVSAGQLDPNAPFGSPPVAGPTVVVTSHRIGTAPATVRAVTVTTARDLPHVKATSYLTAITARRQAREQGADEAILVTGDGTVLEGASTNVFAVVDGVLVTPPVRDGLLAGVTRSVVLELADALDLPTDVRSLAVDELQSADEAFVTASVRGLVPLVEVDRAVIASGTPGRRTAQLQAAYADQVRREQRTGGAT
ncbi:MAG: aminotransferase class IV [Nitriliruptoraceae bacterium]